MWDGTANERAKITATEKGLKSTRLYKRRLRLLTLCTLISPRYINVTSAFISEYLTSFKITMGFFPSYSENMEWKYVLHADRTIWNKSQNSKCSKFNATQPISSFFFLSFLPFSPILAWQRPHYFEIASVFRSLFVVFVETSSPLSGCVICAQCLTLPTVHKQNF